MIRIGQRGADVEEDESSGDSSVQKQSSLGLGDQSGKVGTTHYFPVQPSPLVGRELEIEAARHLIATDVRLLSFVGPPGIGKTRLALAVATLLASEFADGAFFVDLAAIATPELVIATVAEALGIQESGEPSIPAEVRGFLENRQILLLIDNFEQVVGAASQIGDLLASCALLKVLVTSQVPLHVRWEHEFPVPPLPLPDPGRLASDRRLLDNAAIRLFLARAQAVKPDFGLNDRTAGAVAAICVRLEGVPLAIELAAARIKLLSPVDLLDRLERQLDLLAGEIRDVPPRQRTMRSAIAWSYNLLDEEEQALLRAVAVFVGGFTLEEAEGIASILPLSAHLILDRVSSLGDHSLLRQEPNPDGASRFRILEAIREYALEQLKTSGEERSVRWQHASLMLALAERAEPELWGSKQAIWFDRLERDHDNLRAALKWTLDNGEEETALRIAAAFWRFWVMRGHLTEGGQWIERVLSRSSGTAASIRAKALDGAGNLARARGDFRRARELHEESLVLRRELRDPWGVAISLNNLGVLATDEGANVQARARYEESLVLFRELGDQRGVAFALNNLGGVARARGDLEQASTLYEESYRAFRELGDDQGVAVSLITLGGVARQRGDWQRSSTALEQSLGLFRQVGDKPGVASSLANLGQLAEDRGDYASSTAFYEEGLTLHRELGDKWGMSVSLRSLARVAQRCGNRELAEPLYRQCLALFQQLGVERQIQECREDLRRLIADRDANERIAGPLAILTPREHEVAALIARGLSNRHIASELVISERTAANHVEHILSKLGFRARAQVATWVIETGLNAARRD